VKILKTCTLALFATTASLLAQDVRFLDWVGVSPPTNPPGRCCAGMAYDARSQLVVLFGGGFSTPITNQTWAWNGTNWAELNPPTSPSPRYAASMSYDPRDSGLLLFGGFEPATLGDTWLFGLVR